MYSVCSVGNSSFKIGVDGGGTKTECILIDEAGTIVAHHLAPGCNPNVAGTEAARATVTAALSALISSPTLNPQLSALSSSPIVATQLFMSGAPTFWQEFAASLNGYGRVTAAPDSLPTLELATGGAPGLVLHARVEDGMPRPAAGTHVTLVIRPEAVRTRGAETVSNAATARVAEAIYVGDRVKYRLVTEGGTRLSVAWPAGADGPLATGSEVDLDIPATAIHWVAA